MPAAEETDYYLDITAEVCPMTFVKTKLLLERVPAGAVVKVRLRGAEPLENVPRSVQEMGHRILDCVADEDGSHLLTVARV